MNDELIYTIKEGKYSIGELVEEAFDFETYLISEESVFPKPVCLSFCNKYRKGVITGMENMEKYLYEGLRTKTLIAHNASFEFGVIYHHFPNLRKLLLKASKQGRIFCTRLYESLLENTRKKRAHNYNSNYSLKEVAMHWCGVDLSEVKDDPDSPRLRFHEYDGHPLCEWPQHFIDYSLQDSVLTYQIYFKQRAELEVPYILSLYPEMFSNATMGEYGMKVDMERVKLLKQECLENVKPHYKWLEENGFRVFDKGKWINKQATKQEYLKKLLETPVFTDSGGISCREEDLLDYIVEYPEDPLLKALLGISKQEKVLNTYIPKLEKCNGRIRTSFKGGANTGRLLASGTSLYPSLNFLQFPRSVPNVTYDVRNCLKAREGYILVAIDFAGLELVGCASMLKKMYGKSAMADMFNYGTEPVDFHSMVAAKFMSMKKGREVTYEEFVKRKKEKEFSEFRQIIKEINLGFPGGIGYDVISATLRKLGVKPYFKVIKETTSRSLANSLYMYYRKKIPTLRMKEMRLNFLYKGSKNATYKDMRRLLWEYKEKHPCAYLKRVKHGSNSSRICIVEKVYGLVDDDLVKIKKDYMNMFKELKQFLSKGHEEYIMKGEEVYRPNKLNEIEAEPAYEYSNQYITRRYTTYCGVCNGVLMQTPASEGFRMALLDILEAYHENPDLNVLIPPYDEIVFEVRESDSERVTAYIDDIATRMLLNMKKRFPGIRITLEGSRMHYWSKAGGDEETLYWMDANSTELRKKKA